MLLTSFGAAALAQDETPEETPGRTYVVASTDSFGDGRNNTTLHVRKSGAAEDARTFTLEAGEVGDLYYNASHGRDLRSYTGADLRDG